MSFLEQFERKTIEHWLGGKLTKSPAWCFGEIALIQGPKGAWTFWSIPRGLRFPDELGCLKDVEQAAGIVLELVKAKNNWSILEEFSAEDHKILRTLQKKYRTDSINGSGGLEPHEVRARMFLNGARKEDFT